MPHTCPVCQKSFKKANHLRDHCKSKSHRLPETLLPTSSTPPSIVPTAVRYLATQGVQSPIQSFGSQCTRCYLWVPNHIALIEHLNRKHLSKSNKIPLPRISTSNSACTVVEPERHIPLQASDLAAPEQKLPSSSAQGPTVTPQATIQNIPTGSRDPLGLLNAYIARNLPKPMDNPSAETRCRACNVIIENKAQHYIEAHPHLKCDDCDRLFDSSDEFEHHVRDTPKHSSCTLCGVSFRSLEPLESCRHIVRCQAAGTSGRLPARCLICSKTYHSVDELSSHVKAVHAYGQSGALYIVNGMARYCLGDGRFILGLRPSCASVVPPREGPRNEVDPDRPTVSPCKEPQTATRFEVPSTPGTREASSPPPVNTAGVSSASATAEAGTAPDGLHGKSGPTGEEGTPRTEGSLAPPGVRERSSSLVVSEVDSWSEVDCEVDGDLLSDFASVDGDGGSGLELASEKSGADPQSGVNVCERSSASSAGASGVSADYVVCEPSVVPSNETPNPEDEAPNTARATRQEEPTPTSPPATSWICKVCNNAPASPMVTMCGHVFCRGCIIAEISKNFRCPTCKHPILVEIKM